MRASLFYMGVIKDGRIPIELNGKMYHMIFTLNAMDEVEDKIGSIDRLADVMQGEGRMKLIKWLFTLLLNEGMDEGEEPLTEQQVGRMIHGGNFKQIQEAIYDSFVIGNRGTKDPPPDDERDDEDDIEEDDEEDEEGKNIQAGEVQ